MAEVVDLRSGEPALARVFRERLKDRKIVAVHCLDSSSISGEVEAVSDDGRVVTLGEGRRRYEIDVERVAIVETARERAGSP
jgi:hypothetical protein